METDRYLFENQDFTIFFAGGNDGSTGIETVLSPALAKNAVAVGCTVFHSLVLYEIPLFLLFVRTMEMRMVNGLIILPVLALMVHPRTDV